MIGNLYSGLCGVLALLLVTVAYTPTYAASLNSITLSPANASIDAGQFQSFVATGTLSDASTQTLESVPTAIAVSYYNGCTLLASGKVQCWGYNQDGELGNGANTPSISPVTVSGIDGVTVKATAIATGYYGSCAVLASGQVQCWGGNLYGQLGNNTTTQSSIPVTVSGIDGATVKATAIARGYGHACALLADKTVQCWGDNHYGQLGDGTNTQSSVPVPVTGITTAIAISAGYRHTCALLADKTVQCWGDNHYGQLGDGTKTQATTPVSVSGIDGTTVQATAIAAGYRHSCVLLADKTVQCWGDNTYGQLGDGSTIQSITPVTVIGITTAAELVAGSQHSCARLSSGQVQCWGGNQSGQLGDSTTTQSTIPVTVSGISTATALAAGYYHNCALLASGQVQCWGYNHDGQLGTSIQSTTPVVVSGISAATGITAGDSHSCALIGGALQCWGYNQNGQLGSGTTTQQYTTPVAVTGINTAAEVKGGGLHTCARLSNGAVQCWGYNQNGQLGNGMTIKSTSPVDVTGIDGATAQATAIAAGFAHSCALLTDKTVQCWGYNYSGQLGNGTTTQSTTPVAVSGIDGINVQATAIAAGYLHTCALLADKTVKCWGFNGAGQLGNGTTTSSTTPVAVIGIDGTTVQATAIAAGYLHTCALLADSSVQCWGDNQKGQLGNGTTSQSNIPVTVTGISSATKIAAAGFRSCALLPSGSVQCWGDNSFGQLGNGTTTQSTTPVTVSDISTATDIATGYAHSCALLSGGAEQCWGDNAYGQLGNGVSAIATTPVYISGVPKVVWSSSNTAAANIDANGLASALSAGNTIITATATDGSVSGSATLYVNSYSVGGTVSGLTGSVMLTNNGTDNLTVMANGNFVFATGLATGAAYNVSVTTQPSGQTCAVSSPSGTVGSAAVTSVTVTCTAAAVSSTYYTIGGTVSGLTGSMVLTNNGGDSLSVAADGAFLFATPLADGAPYSIAVATRPSGQSCALSNGSGTIGGANVSNVTISCSATSVAPLSTATSSGGGGGAASPLLLGLLGLILSMRRSQFGRHRID